MPLAAAHLAARHPAVALIFEHGEPPQADRRDTTMTPLLDEPLYVVAPGDDSRHGPGAELAGYAETRWIAGCQRCREHLVSACEEAGFSPIVEFETDDYVAVQALVAAGLGVSLLPGLTLVANRNPGVRLEPIVGMRRQVVAAVHGKPPASQPAQVLLDALKATISEPEWPC